MKKFLVVFGVLLLFSCTGSDIYVPIPTPGATDTLTINNGVCILVTCTTLKVRGEQVTRCDTTQCQ